MAACGRLLHFEQLTCFLIQCDISFRVFIIILWNQKDIWLCFAARKNKGHTTRVVIVICAYHCSPLSIFYVPDFADVLHDCRQLFALYTYIVKCLVLSIQFNKKPFYGACQVYRLVRSVFLDFLSLKSTSGFGLDFFSNIFFQFPLSPFYWW